MACLPKCHHGITLAIAATLLVGAASGFRYTVGDSIWAIPPTSDFYSRWSSAHAFYAGDTLVFQFATELFNVVQVLRHDFESCIADAPLQVLTIGPAVVDLSHKGVFYYICNVSNYCDLGLKVAVVVHPRPPAAQPLVPSSPPPLPPDTPPHPPASPPPPVAPPPPVPPHGPNSQPALSPGQAPETSRDVGNNSSRSPAPSNESNSTNYWNGASRVGDRRVIGLLLVGILTM